MRASFGTPGRQSLLTGATLRRWEIRELRIARRALMGARVSLLVGLVLIAIAIGIVWLGGKPAQQASLVVSTTRAAFICGELIDGNSIGLAIKPVGATAGTQAIRLLYAEIETITVVSKCPTQVAGAGQGG
jgi:hypothetical protein